MTASRQTGLYLKKLATDIDLLALRQAWPARYPYLLQSVQHTSELGRYDILLAFPGEPLVLFADGRLQLPPGLSASTDGFLATLDDWWQSYAHESPEPATELPFRGGWFLYLGYELAGEIEPSLRQPPPISPMDHEMPVALASYCPAALIHDRHKGEVTLLAEREELLEGMLRDLARAPALADADRCEIEGLQEDEPQDYLLDVQRIRDYIRDGDVFQVNLSRCWQAEVPPSVTADALYRALCRANPAPFAGLAELPGGTAIISSSPERLVRVRQGEIDTRPIAGTRPRGGSDEDDQARSEELMLHPKERAEHIMLIDLERNDLGRVCVPGSVEVNELMVLESYAHVHHIVSNVRGRLRPGTRPGEVIRAVFPGGTITGCPKVRCMEIIAELEKTRRGPYTGSMGYLNRNGDMDLNILIRTMLYQPGLHPPGLHPSGGRVSLRAGAGIVNDSIPERELEETRAKAKGLLRALLSGDDLRT